MNQKTNVLLVVEDDPGLQKQMRWSFDAYDTKVVGNRESTLAQVRKDEPAVVILDLGLPTDANGTSEGMATLEQLMELAPDIKVIVVTGNQDRVNAVRAVAMGAYDFYQKPFDPEVLQLVVERAFRLHALEQENRRLQQSQDAPTNGILTRDPGDAQDLPER